MPFHLSPREPKARMNSALGMESQQREHDPGTLSFKLSLELEHSFARRSRRARLRPTSAVDFVSCLRKYSRMSDKSDSEQIDDIIARQSGWKQDVLVALRAAIMAGDPAAVEVVKYKKPSKPEGVPFWTHDGDVCFVDVLKTAVRLTFARGARMERSDLFNTRLDSKVVRAIDYFDGDRVDEAAVKALVAEAVELNVAAR